MQVVEQVPDTEGHQGIEHWVKQARKAFEVIFHEFLDFLMGKGVPEELKAVTSMAELLHFLLETPSLPHTQFFIRDQKAQGPPPQGNSSKPSPEGEAPRAAEQDKLLGAVEGELTPAGLIPLPPDDSPHLQCQSPGTCWGHHHCHLWWWPRLPCRLG